MNEKIKWTFGENLICCEVYIKNYVKHNTGLSLTEAINEVLKAAPRFKGGKEGSVRIKLQNIKQLCIEHKVNIAGIFAAGDCTGRPYQYAKSVGEGNVAAHSVVQFLAENK